MPTLSTSQASLSIKDLLNALPPTPLYEGNPEDNIGWKLSPEPYSLTPQQYQQIQQLGPALYSFSKALDQLDKQSQKDPQWSWVSTLLSAGKPESLLKFAQMKRFKNQLPLVIRPDLLVTEHGLALTEIDAVPGGLGFTAALQHAYRSVGFAVVEHTNTLPQAFLNMLLAQAPQNNPTPTIAVVVSDEAGDYRAELRYLVERLQAITSHVVLLHPKEITLERTQLGYVDEQNHFHPVHMIYRFFELFDLPNIPQIELIQYAVKKGLVVCTPPFKPHLEEKLALGLFHHLQLQGFFKQTLSPQAHEILQQVIPQTWILDPTPVPPHAAIQPALQFGSSKLHQFEQLAQLSQKQRELVLKPSGFSPLAWGSRGVTVGHDVSQEQWQQAVNHALSQFESSPWVLQRFHNTRVEPYRFFDPQSGEIREGEGRTRLCPYYFVTQDTVELAGILATTCPKDKKIIHGMRDGVMRPAMVSTP